MRHPENMASLRKQIIGDSWDRAKALTKLIRLVRDDERRRTIADLNRVKDRVEAK